MQNLTIDAAIFMLTRCSPKTPVRSLVMHGEFNLDTCIAMMVEAFRALHKAPDRQRLLLFLMESCYDQSRIVERAERDGFPVADYLATYDKRGTAKQDWRGRLCRKPGRQTAAPVVSGIR